MVGCSFTATAAVPPTLPEESTTLPRLQRLGYPCDWQQPADREGLVQTIRAARAEGLALVPAGSGSRLDWGGLLSRPAIALSVRRLNHLIDHAAGDLTVTAEAGMTLAELQQHLARENQFLPIDPLYAGRTTVGGLIATAHAGSLRHRYGSLRDLLLGIEILRWDGEAAKAGGRVVKNVAGYDLMKLYHGSFGTLGLITEVTLRVYPLPEVCRTVAIAAPVTELGELRRRIADSRLGPIAFDLISAGLAVSLGLSGPQLLVRFGGVEAAVVHQTEQLLALAGADRCRVIAADPGFWSQEIVQPLEADGDGQAPLVRLALLPSQLPGLLEQLPASASARLHAGSGVGYIRLAPNTPVADLEQWRRFCNQHQGYLTLLEGPTTLKQAFEVWGYDGSALPRMRAIRDRFDPQRLFSPGRFLPGLD